MVGAVGGLNIAPPNGRQHTHTFPINPFFFFFFFFLFLYRNVVGLARSIYIRDKPETLSLLAAWGRGSPRSVRGRAGGEYSKKGRTTPHTPSAPRKKRGATSTQLHFIRGGASVGVETCTQTDVFFCVLLTSFDFVQLWL
jgi:hypothetical protein